jgi:hypothetical protein
MKLSLLSAALLIYLPFSLWAGELAGKVDFVSGEVTITQESGQKHQLKMGDNVNTGDTLTSAANSEAHIHMQDEAYLALRANSRVLIKNYQAQNKPSDNSALQLFKGSLRIVTGWIGQQYPKNYKVNTPTATIGVRGTDHEPLYIAPEDASEEQPAGTYDHVVEGSTMINNEEGQIEVSVNNIGFTPITGRPRLLDHLPHFFPQGVFDQRINDIKPLLKQHIQERLQQIHERIQTIKEQGLRLKNQHQEHALPLPNVRGFNRP